MNISKLKIAWCYLTGGGTKVIDYILDIANNAVNALGDESKERVAEILAAVKRIISIAQACSWLVPTKWRDAYGVTLAALADVQAACEDLKITSGELETVIISWQMAYSSWRAE